MTYLNTKNGKTELMTMPTEIFERFFICLDDKNLLAASRVCKRIGRIAESEFGRRYMKKTYKVSEPNGSEFKFHGDILSKFGDKISSIAIKFNNSNESFLKVIEQKCYNLKTFQLSQESIDFESIRLKSLKSVCFNARQFKGKEHYLKYIENNPQLESLVLIKHSTNANDPIRLMDFLLVRLRMLKVLKLQDIYDHRMFIERFHSKNIKIVRLHLLEKLKLSFDFNDYHFRTLQVIVCENLRKLHLDSGCDEDSEANNNLITQIIRFKMLRSLQLHSHCVEMNYVKKLMEHLPHLTKFGIKLRKSESNIEIENQIFSVLSMFPKLTTLKVFLPDYERLLFNLNGQSLYAFHNQFTAHFPNTEVKIIRKFKYENLNKLLSISKDQIYIRDRNILEIHWMNNFNEQNIRNTFNKASKTERSYHTITDLKFINQCSDNLDISILSSMQSTCSNPRHLEITSNGPISINAIVSKKLNILYFLLNVMITNN